MSDERRRVTAEKAARMIRELIETGASRQHLAEVADLHVATVSNWLAAMREAKLVRLSDWLPDARGYPTIELFRWAPDEPDAIKRVRNQAERMRDWRAAKRAEVAS